jgi:hypothetical protein
MEPWMHCIGDVDKSDSIFGFGRGACHALLLFLQLDVYCYGDADAVYRL